MTESFESPKISRQEVIDAYRKFSDAGVKDPADLDLSDPEAAKTKELYEKWMDQGDVETAQDEKAWRRHNLDKTALIIDAGFVGKDYLEDAIDWLNQDLDNAEGTDDAELVEAIKNKIKEIEAMIAQEPNKSQ